MIPVSYSVPWEKSSPRFASAFAAGCGGPISTDLTRLQPGPFAAFCTPPTWPLLQQAQVDGRDWYYGDHGYFQRFQYYRITRSAYQHDGSGEATPERFDRLGYRVQPWRRTGSHVIVCPNSRVYFSLFGIKVEEWLAHVVRQVGAHTDRLINIRWKADGPIHDDLQKAWAVVTYSSAAAIDALIAGVPVFVLAPFAAAYRMGTPDLSCIETPLYPDGREPFLWNLAANQWSMDEISSGVAWRALQHREVPRAA